jgi:hypothetical protein
MKEEKIEYKIVKTKKGFTVWVKEGGVTHWIVDGSNLFEDNIIRIAKKISPWKIYPKKLKTMRWEDTVYEVIKK